MVYEVKGDLLSSNVQYICHQVNCQGVMGAGIAKKIKEKWPDVYDAYLAWYNLAEDQATNDSPPEWSLNPGDIMLGNIQVVDVEGHKIVNMASQEHYGHDGRRYTSYDAFWSCLGQILCQAPKGSKIGFPKYIGCGFGGANWPVIKTMIAEVLGKDFEVYIYELN